MPKADAATVSRLLREFGQYSALQGDNPYRAKAYARAADSMAALAVPIEHLVAEDRLTEVPGVGNAIADIVTKLHKTGTHPKLEQMRKETPPSVLEMLAVPELRPEKVLKLHRELGIESLADLEAAARADKLKTVKGLGPALQAKILRSISISRENEGRRHIHRAAALLDNAAKTLRTARPDLKRIMPAGEFRRGCELVGDLVLVAEAASRESGPKVLKSGELTVQLTDKQRFGVSLLLGTGSDKHLAKVRAIAAAKGMQLSDEGLFRGRKLIAAADEEEIYAALDLQFIPPELREGADEIERARKRKIPKLVTDQDIRGILHAHTNLSDGVNTLEEMAEATRARGYQYFGVADHSQSAHYAGGLSLEEIDQQHAAIDRLNKKFGRSFRVFKGIESDILADGSLDYPDPVLARFDFVVASVHSRFGLNKHEQTARIIRAIQNPRTTVLGHMTGRQLLRRPGYEVDIEAILKTCSANGVAVEINANPWRLDLDWRWHRRALEVGCMMSINPDAHSIKEIDLTHWGVEMARKGGVPVDRVLNSLTLAQMSEHLRGRRSRP
jgi:DNA polymerase (family 10)